MRRVMLVLGLILLVAGGLISAGMLRWPDNREVLRIGDAALTVQRDRRPDPRLGHVLLALGAVSLTLAAFRRRR